MLTTLIGWFATIVIIISFLIRKDMFLLRVINLIGTILWILYGVLNKDIPLSVLNLIVAIIHIVWFIKYYKNEN